VYGKLEEESVESININQGMGSISRSSYSACDGCGGGRIRRQCYLKVIFYQQLSLF
jgi:hypothetical protein